MEELIAVLFLSREIAHREHLTSDSYAQHMALGGFYEGVVELADSLAEAYQGSTCNRLSKIPYYSNPMKGDITMTMKKMSSRVTELREEACGDNTTLQNIVDEILSLFYSTIYKLTFLK